MPTRTSKISRLPKAIRHQLSQHIEDGRLGKDIILWLNGLPEVQRIVADQFNGSAISEQNLSDWKSSGHQDWLQRQEAREAALSLLTSAEDLDLDDPGQQRLLLDNFAAILAVELSRLSMLLLKKETDPEKKWKLVCQINQELAKLRRAHDRATSVTVTREKWAAEAERQKQEAERQAKEAVKQRYLTMLTEGKAKRANAGELYGFGSKEKAELYYRLKFDLPLDGLLDPSWRTAGAIRFRSAAPTNPNDGNHTKGQ